MHNRRPEAGFPASASLHWYPCGRQKFWQFFAAAQVEGDFTFSRPRMFDANVLGSIELYGSDRLPKRNIPCMKASQI
jgi:hypothetical protein